MKKVITIVLIAAIAATSAVAMTGCKSDKKDAAPSAAPTAAVTESATQAQAATQAENQTATQAANNDASSGTSSSTSSSTSSGAADSQAEEYAGVTKQEAIDHVLDFYDDADSVQILEAYQGTYPTQGWDAWVITAQEPDDTTRTFYCGFAFCIPQDRHNANDGTDEIGISQQDAIDHVEERIGDFDTITSVEKGATPEDWSCWVLTVKHMDESTTTWYCGYLFCYPAE